MVYDNRGGERTSASDRQPVPRPPARPLTDVRIQLFSDGCSASFLIGQVYEAIRRGHTKTLAMQFVREVQRGNLAHMYRVIQTYVTIE